MFAAKVAKPQTKATASSTNTLTRQSSTPVARRPSLSTVSETLTLQRTFGNEATLRLLAQPTPSLIGNEAHDANGREADGKNLATPKATRGIGWDFSKITVFTPDRPKRLQNPSTLPSALVPGTVQPQLAIGRPDDPLAAGLRPGAARASKTPASARSWEFGESAILPPVPMTRAIDQFQAAGEVPAAEIGDQVDAGTIAGAPVPVPAVPAVACAQPVSWTHATARNFGPDAIQIDITWQSSTGNLADLGNCTVREVVSYDPIPNPPFMWNPPNPTILTVPATVGAGQDTHSYPPGLRTGITDPRSAGTMTAHQAYQFRCTGPGCSGTWTDIPGQAYTLTREVVPQYVRLNPWSYLITKQGVGNMFKYKREVEIPPP
jgi:hypothetical protein